MSSAAVAAFNQLHQSGCFVMPNPWDVGTAMYLERLGCKALATTSAGLAFTRGLPDELSAIPKDAMLAHIKELVAATALPVNADFQAGFADDLEGLFANVSACVATGVAGLSIEDATGDPIAPLFDQARAIERVRTARGAIDKSGAAVILTARCEAFLVRAPDAERVVLDRLVAFADAGADCLYAPGIRDLDIVAAIVRAVTPKPVNVIVASASPGFTVQGLADVGVRRISVGSALARVAWGAFIRTAKEIVGTGTFDTLADAATFEELNAVFR